MGGASLPEGVFGAVLLRGAGWGALFGHFWGPAPGYSFRTLFGLFRGSGPEGPGRPFADLMSGKNTERKSA